MMSLPKCIICYLTIHCWVECDLITPTTFPDDFLIDPDVQNNLDLVENTKPWFAYVHSFIEKSMSECLSKGQHDSAMGFWQTCFFHYQPSYQAMNQKLAIVCPWSGQLSFIYGYRKVVADRNIIRNLTTETESCFPVLFTFRKKVQHIFFVSYCFHTHPWLKMNVTFTKFELYFTEWVQVFRTSCLDKNLMCTKVSNVTRKGQNKQ